MTPAPDAEGSRASGPLLKVAVLTSVHMARDTRIYHRQCRALAAAGHEVVLIAREIGGGHEHGIRAIAVGAARGRLHRLLVIVPRVTRRAFALQADVYHLHDPELLPTGLLLRLAGHRVVYDAHEDMPRRIRDKTHVPWPLRAVAAVGVAGLEWISGRALTVVVAATPRIAARFPADRRILVQNFPDMEEFTGIDTSDYATRPALLVSVGDIAVERGIREMIAALSRLGRERGELALAGRIATPRLRGELQGDVPANLRLMDWQERPEVVRLLSRARAGLALLHPIPAYRESQPIKIFEYMAAGLPVIASDFPHWRALLDPHDCAIFVDPLSPDAIAEAMAWVFDHPGKARDMGRRGREAVHARFNWESERRRLLACYERIAAQRQA